MCGKFTQMMSWGGLVHLADLLGRPVEGDPVEGVTPMRFATVIRLGADGRRETARMRWGFLPPHAKDPNTPIFIHARAESIEEKPTFREAFFQRRGLVVVRSFNEGKEITPKKTEQHVITFNDGKPVAIAAIWQRWTAPNGAGLDTFAMVTVPPNALIATITDRMPAVIGAEHWARWLGEERASVQDLKAMLTPFEGDWTMRPEKPRPEPKVDTSQPSLF